MDLVSIIIPVFNSEKYIRKCLDSVLSQTYNCIQVIIIDDGSTDNSYEICKEYTSSNANFELYHTENRGVSHARNVGLEYAKGKYIFFVDSDDYVMPSYIEHLMDMGNYDYIGGGYRENNEQGWKKEYRTYYITIEDLKKDCRNSWEKVPSVHVHGSRYVKKIIATNLIKFGEAYSCGEDVRFNIEYFKHISSIAVSDKSEYIYCLHDESAIHKYWPERLKEEKEECIAKEQLYVQNDSFNFIRYVHWLIALEHYYQYINQKKEARAKLKETIWDPYFRQCIRYCMKQGTLDMKIAAVCLIFGTYSAYKRIIKLYVDRGRAVKMIFL